MASNTPPVKWSVRVTQIPIGINKNDLAQELRLHPSRIYVSRPAPNQPSCAWINDFNSEHEAKEFVQQWSGANIRGHTINCIARLSKNEQQNVSAFVDMPEPLREPSTVPKPRLPYRLSTNTPSPNEMHTRQSTGSFSEL